MKRDGDDLIDPPVPDLAPVLPRKLTGKDPSPAPSILVFKTVDSAGYGIRMEPQPSSLVNGGPPARAGLAVLLRLIPERLAAVHAPRLADTDDLLPACRTDPF